MADLKRICDALQAGDVDTVVTLTRQALDEGLDVETILNEALLKGMDIIGEKFKASEVFVPDVIFAARAMTSAMELLQPILTEHGVEPVGQVIIGTVKGDLHDIGKNLVAMMLSGGGFLVSDLGHDVTPERFIDAARQNPNAIVAMSALLTTTMPRMADVVQGLKKAGLKKVKVMIGGAPVTRNFAAEIGAHGYAPDAATAVDLAKSLVGA